MESDLPNSKWPGKITMGRGRKVNVLEEGGLRGEEGYIAKDRRGR